MQNCESAVPPPRKPLGLTNSSPGERKTTFHSISSRHMCTATKRRKTYSARISRSRGATWWRSAKKVFDQVKASAAPNTPIIWSEYNATYLNQPEVTDSAFMGPWLANNIRECDGLASSMCYWDLSDVFEVRIPMM